MKAKPLLLALSLLLGFALPAHAHHPGADLDEVMGSEEKFFQAIDEPAAPAFELADADGKTVRLSDFSDKIVGETGEARARMVGQAEGDVSMSLG
jgi:protein SCO1